jgi:hypothetical protein
MKVQPLPNHTKYTLERKGIVYASCHPMWVSVLLFFTG